MFLEWDVLSLRTSPCMPPLHSSGVVMRRLHSASKDVLNMSVASSELLMLWRPNWEREWWKRSETWYWLPSKSIAYLVATLTRFCSQDNSPLFLPTTSTGVQYWVEPKESKHVFSAWRCFRILLALVARRKEVLPQFPDDDQLSISRDCVSTRPPFQSVIHRNRRLSTP